ncbi:MAG: biotin transporter BioY [Syntrophomonadaceae bacterium]|nr:biotin transporter BioY [Syntrophomonadaceae bacterium]
MKLRSLILVALFAAITSVLAQVSIPVPFSPVPLTGQTFAVFLAGAILGSKLGAMSMVVYLLLGAIGLPVFAQAKAGIGVLIGHTGGYLFGFVVGAYILGKIVENSKGAGYGRMLTGMVASLVIAYTLGAIQLALVLGWPMEKAVMLGVIPFIPLDGLKIILAAGVAISVRRSLLAAGLLPESSARA